MVWTLSVGAADIGKLGLAAFARFIFPLLADLLALGRPLILA
jgi:hypothetical protein